MENFHGPSFEVGKVHGRGSRITATENWLGARHVPVESVVSDMKPPADEVRIARYVSDILSALSSGAAHVRCDVAEPSLVDGIKKQLGPHVAKVSFPYIDIPVPTSSKPAL